MKLLAYEYNIESNDFCYVGFACNARTWFKMLEWKIDENQSIYFLRHKTESSIGVFHWTKEGLIDELKQLGIIS